MNWLVFVSILVSSAHVFADQHAKPWHEFYWGIDHLARPLLEDLHIQTPEALTEEVLPGCTTVTVTVSKTGQPTTVDMEFLKDSFLPEPLRTELKLVLMGAQYQPGTDESGKPIDSIIPITAFREGNEYRIETDIVKITCIYPELRYREESFVSPNHNYTVWFKGYDHGGRFSIHHGDTARILYEGQIRYGPMVQWIANDVVELQFATSPFTTNKQYYLPKPDIMSKRYHCTLDCLPGSQVLAYLGVDDHSKAHVFFADVVSGDVLFSSPVPPIMLCAYNCGCCYISGTFLPDGRFELQYDCSRWDNHPELLEEIDPVSGHIQFELPPEILNRRPSRKQNR